MRSLIPIAALVSSVAAWGAAGHEIVATIAQILLTDHTRDQLCLILPPWSKCHLAPVAPWADQIKRFPEWRSWTSAMHYVNPIGDWPSKHCEFGESGWHAPDRNLLVAITNYTRIVAESSGQDQDYALRFLVHYVGDIHQPLHLTGRERGGNGIKVRFDRRISSLHGVWDGGLITKSIREMTNYTHPLPDKRIENALRGTIYDPYVRFIVKEGLLGWWKNEYPSWSLCPAEPASSPTYARSHASQKFFRATNTTGLITPISDDPDLPVCPYHWAEPLHKLNCEIVFPPELDTPDPNKRSWLTKASSGLITLASNPRPEYLELDTPKYAGYIRDHKILEKLLAQAGVRLAAVLNDIFDPSTDGAREQLVW
ncbi:hypothetical protein FRB93_010138 [Tulasnella sp. JGI-2019a]|nr:hypothetical protein FRB93_010138 [Tulasnella sp. JGI-2019a]